MKIPVILNCDVGILDRGSDDVSNLPCVSASLVSSPGLVLVSLWLQGRFGQAFLDFSQHMRCQSYCGSTGRDERRPGCPEVYTGVAEARCSIRTHERNEH